MNADVPRFLTDLRKHTRAVADANVLIYHLEGLQPYAQLTRALLALLAEGALSLIVSVVTAGEILAGPYRAADQAKVALATGFLQGMPHTTLADVNFTIADRAAWLRSSGLRMPDALVIGTAVVYGVDVVLTNDPMFQRPISGVPPVMLLDTYCPSSQGSSRRRGGPSYC